MSFFRNHDTEDANAKSLRYLVLVEHLFRVEEGVYLASKKDAEKLFRAYEEITNEAE